jgi:fatty-acyl-CoA synthase
MHLADLFTLRIFTVDRLYRLIRHVLQHGIQLSNVMHMCSDKSAVAIKHREHSVTYEALFNQIGSVSGFIYRNYEVKQGSQVLIIVDNSIPSVVLLMALSALGCNIHAIGSMKDYDELKRTVDLRKYHLIFSAIEERPDYYDVTSIHYITRLWDEAVSHERYDPFVSVHTKISIFTSGSTNVAKRSGRSNTLLQYLKVITDLVKTLRLHTYQSVMLPVPIYHSYGLSVLFLGLMLNKTIVLVNKFDAAEVANEIEAGRVEVAVLIPQMLHRLLGYDLSSLRCIVSCADVLPTTVLQSARKKFGDIVFNLYGTTETGLVTIATPEMLAVKPGTIGRPIKGSKLKLSDENGSPVLHVRSEFASNGGYVSTGDIAEIDESGWYFLKGRIDHLLVVNGVNVYPNEILEMAYKNESVQDAVVRKFKDENGFTRIKLVLSCRGGHEVNETEFREWWLEHYGTRFLPTTVEFADEVKSKLM